jgi:hypothetical protein
MTSPANSSPVSFVLNSGKTYIDALLNGTKWDSTFASTTITYSFPWTTNANAVFSGLGGSAYSADGEPTAAQHYGLNAVQQQAATSALQAWASVANVNLVQVQETSTSVGDIRVAFTSAKQNSSDGGDAWGWAYLPEVADPASGDVWISTSNTDSNWSASSYNYMSLIHELGHALGLKHPFEDGITDPAHANRQYSIMAYDDAPNSMWVDFSRTSSGYSWQAYNVVPDSPMVDDIAAIQYLYGANTSYETGDNTYTFDPATPFLHTIWDAGGNDTISIANFTMGSVIDLQAGHYSSLRMAPEQSPAGIVWNTAPPGSTYDGTNNLGIAYGVTIENAIGGSGNDALIGNAVSNHLQGNGGANTIDGGAGIDTAVYIGNFNSYALAPSSTGYIVTLVSNPSQTDTLTNIERLSFANASMGLNVNSLAEDALQAQYTALAEKFYVAYFGRPADANGLANMVSQFNGANVPTNTSDFVGAYSTNATVKALIDSFGNSAESATLYHGSNRDFVTSIYAHLLGRTPDQEGLDYWTTQLDNGNLARGWAALNIAAGAEANKTAQGQVDAALVANRVTVAANFTALLDTQSEVAGYAGDAAAATARLLLNNVDQNTSILAYESTIISTVATMTGGVQAEIIGLHESGHSLMMA